MKTFSLLISGIALIAVSCGTPEAKSPNDDSAIMPLANSEPTLQEKQDNARFIVDTYEDSMEIPHSKVSVEYNESRTFLNEIIGVAEVQLGGNEEMEVPKDAIASCGCWYAGGGDYFYIARSDKGIKIFHGWLDEMQEDEGYHWEELKNIE